MCEYHEEVYKQIDPQLINIIEKFSPKIQEVIDLVGAEIGTFIMSPMGRIGPDGEIGPIDNAEVPEPMKRMLNACGLLYLVSWLAAEASPNEDFDNLLTNVFANGVNDGNAYLCHNKSKGN